MTSPPTAQRRRSWRPRPEKVKELAARWQAWAERVGVVPWERLPGSNYQPAKGYAKKSEPVLP